MPESRRFDPLGWFVSACFTVLAGAVALTVAIHLIQIIWLWLTVITGVAILGGIAITLIAWWLRRRSW